MNPAVVWMGPEFNCKVLTCYLEVIPPSLVEEINTYLFKVREDIKAQTTPNSKKNILSLYELLTTKESANVFDLINNWVWKNLTPKEDGDRIVASGGVLYLQAWADRLTKERSNIVLLCKTLEENICRLEALSNIHEVTSYVMSHTEKVCSRIQTTNGVHRMREIFSKLGKLSANRSLESIRKKQMEENAAEVFKNKQQKRKRSSTSLDAVTSKKTKLIAPLPAALPKQKRKTPVTSVSRMSNGGKNMSNMIAFKKHDQKLSNHSSAEEGECSSSSDSESDSN